MKPVETTAELSEIIRASIPMKFQKKSGHPAKRTFQAIRIELNRELDVLRDSLDDMIDLLNPGGIMHYYISFVGGPYCEECVPKE